MRKALQAILDSRKKLVLRLTFIFLLLSACAGVPEYPSPYSAPGNTYAERANATGPAPDAPALSAAPCVSYYTSEYPPPLGLVPCPMPLLSTYPGYPYSFYPAYGYSLYGTRRITPFHAAGNAGRTFRHTTGHTHSGRRGRK